MAVDYLGMLGLGASDAQAAQQQEIALRQAMSQAQLAPEQRFAFAAARGGAMLGDAAGGMLRGLAGQPNAQETLARVKAQLAVALKDVDPNDIDKVYPIVIRILTQNGMSVEAMQATREYEKIKNEREDRVIKNRAITSRETSDAARVALAREALTARDPMKLIEAYAKTYEALESGTLEGDAKTAAQGMLKALEAKLGFKPVKQANEWKVQISQGNATEPARMVRYNSTTGETQITDLQGKPVEQIKAEKGGGKPIPGSILQDWAKGFTTAARYKALGEEFKPNYAFADMGSKAAGATGFQDLITKLQSYQASTPEKRAAAAWWAKLAYQIVQVRHDIFGATLTQGEQQAFDTVRPLVGQAPEVVADRLRMLQEASAQEMKNKLLTFERQGFDVQAQKDELARITGMPMPKAAPAAAPISAPGLPPGVTVKVRG